MSESERAAFASAAHALVGTPFRLHGREPASGVDCIGLVHCALAAIGRQPPSIPQYTLRNLDITPFMPLVAAAGFCASRGPGEGDIVLLRPSAAQFHLAIQCGDFRLVHAHAGLGRVVSSPAPPAADIHARWHLI